MVNFCKLKMFFTKFIPIDGHGYSVFKLVEKKINNLIEKS